MVVFIIIFNLSLTLLNLYIAIRLWQLRHLLLKVTRTLTRVERRIHKIIYPAPEFILTGQQGTYTLHKSYHKLLFQMELVIKILSLVTFGSKIWQRQRRLNLVTSRSAWRAPFF